MYKYSHTVSRVTIKGKYTVGICGESYSNCIREFLCRDFHLFRSKRQNISHNIVALATPFNTLYSYVKFKYYLINEQECFIGFKTRGEAERFISDKARTASFLNGFKNVSVRSRHWRSNFEDRQSLKNSKLKFMQIKRNLYHI